VDVLAVRRRRCVISCWRTSTRAEVDASVGLPAARYVATPRDHADRRVALAGRIQEYRFWPPVGPHGILREL